MNLWGIYDLGTGKDAGWLREHHRYGPILAYEDDEKAKQRAASEYGYDDYDEAKADGWCEVLPLTGGAQ